MVSGFSPYKQPNWEAESGERWAIPVGGSAGKVVKIGNLPVNIQSQAFYNFAKPENVTEGQLRLQMQLLFPK